MGVGAHFGLVICRVLTMEQFFGAPLIDLAAVERVTTANPEKVLISALNTWFGSVLQAETFHADVHAGTQSW